MGNVKSKVISIIQSLALSLRTKMEKANNTLKTTRNPKIIKNIPVNVMNFLLFLYFLCNSKYNEIIAKTKPAKLMV